MAILEYSEITSKKYIALDGEPYEVLESHVFRKQQRKPVNQVKLQHLMSGRVVERSFHQSEKVSEVDIDSRRVKYLYNNRGLFWFCEENDPSKRFSISSETVGKRGVFMKANAVVDLLSFNARIVGFKMPVKVDLKVVEAPPAVRGNTVQGGVKQAKLETGITINVPLFINEGDIIRVNSDTGEYVERADKS